MGVVYKARQKSLDRIVALKMLLFGPHAPPEAVKRFRAEAVATAALQHPNIVAIHEVGLWEGQHFLVMDFVEGPSLAKVISDFKFQISNFRRPAGYVKTIAEAIHYAHERGILHRDLKPSNILIDANDQPRVTDFGLAKRLVGDSELTVSGQVLGSPNYMPPEQASGKRGTLSRRSDVYALGAILYHAMTGRPPFVGEGLADTVQQVLNTEPVPPRVLNPRLPADLETVCLKCLEKEPAKRYATAQLLAEELSRFLEGKPVLARPVSRLAKLWRWCRRNPRLAGVTAGLVLAIVAGFVGVLGQLQRAKAAELTTRRNAYAADMNLVQPALEDNDLGSARELLNRHRPSFGVPALAGSPHTSSSERPDRLKAGLQTDLRGWEWRYLWARCQSDERFTLVQYSNSVSALAFSPDGHWLAVRQEDGVVALWDPLAKRLLAELPADAVRWRWCNKALAFSPRGNLLAWGNGDASGGPIVTLRDVSAQREVAQFPLSADLVSVAFAPDAKELATLAYDGTVRVWDLASQQVVTNFLTAPVNIWTERLSTAAGPMAASAADEAVGRRESNSPSPQARTRLSRSRIFTDHYGCVLFSPDGRWLAVGEAKPRIQLLDRATGKSRELPVSPPADGITALAFSPDSRLLAAACGFGDNAVHVWDLAADTEVRLAGHSDWIAALAFSPDGQTLASASADQTLRLWEVARQAERRRFQGNTDGIWALAWSPDGKGLVTGAKDGSVRYWDPAAKPAPPPYAVLSERIAFFGPTFLPDSKTFLTVSWPAGLVVRWEAATVQKVESLPFLGTNHSSLGLSKDGRWLALGDRSGNVRVWDFQARQLVTNLVSPESQVFVVQFSPQGNILTCGNSSSDGRTVIRLWAVAGWRELSLQGINLKNLTKADFSPDERTLAIGYGDGTAAWWNLATGQQQTFFDCHYANGVIVVFSPDGRLFATAGFGGLMTVWDAATRRARLSIRGHRNVLHGLAFSPDGQRLIATGSSPNGLVKLWDVETGRDVATLPGEAGSYPNVGFSPDGNTLFAAGLEGTALLWRAPSWGEIAAAEAKETQRAGAKPAGDP